jgi:two-component system sensor histidine kinase RegB
MYGRWHHITLRLQDDALADEYARIVWLGFTFASALIVFFVRRISGALAQREHELEEIRARAVRRERLASLATLAAGAAHELATPLSTIAVVVKEMQRNLPDDASAEVRGDLQMVRDQVGRCRDILDRMSARAGETAGEPLSDMTVRAWVDASLDNFPARARVALQAGPGALDAVVRGPARALADMLRGLLKNAAQASPGEAPITLRTSLAGGIVHVSVADRGRGMSPEVLQRVGEPFYTTKGPGEGMGLGVFLTRALAEQLGGDFRIASTPGEGTEATVELPAVSG